MAALSRMRPRDRGSIVNVGSALAFIGIPLQAAYCSSKFACRGFFESTRAELLHEGSHVRMSMVHLPAVNTPQFDWCETTLDRHPQPVPPIYQPEVPAHYILEAALTGRPAKVVGSWNKLLVVAGRLFPGLGNQYAALGAWDTQLTSEPVAPDRPVNLFEPADAEQDHGAHGIFDDKAGGFFDPSFLKSLPATARTFVTAVARTAAEKRRVYAATASWRARANTATSVHVPATPTEVRTAPAARSRGASGADDPLSGHPTPVLAAPLRAPRSAGPGNADAHDPVHVAASRTGGKGSCGVRLPLHGDAPRDVVELLRPGGRHPASPLPRPGTPPSPRQARRGSACRLGPWHRRQAVRRARCPAPRRPGGDRDGSCIRSVPTSPPPSGPTLIGAVASSTAWMNKPGGSRPLSSPLRSSPRPCRRFRSTSATARVVRRPPFRSPACRRPGGPPQEPSQHGLRAQARTHPPRGSVDGSTVFLARCAFRPATTGCGTSPGPTAGSPTESWPSTSQVPNDGETGGGGGALS